MSKLLFSENVVVFQRIVGTVVGKTRHSQRKFPCVYFNLRESLNQKNIVSDLIHVEVSSHANIASEAVRNFQPQR